MGERDERRRAIGLGELVRFLIVTLVKWAQLDQWGEIRIVVQKGQIVTVAESVTYQGGMPKRQSLGQGNPVDAVAERAAADVTAVQPKVVQFGK